MSELPKARPPVRVAIAGFGAIGKPLAQTLQASTDFSLVAIAARDPARTSGQAGACGLDVPVIPVAELPFGVDVVIDAAPSDAFAGIAHRTLAAGKILLTVNAAALLENMEVVELARRQGGRILLATGALLGLDAVRAAALGRIGSVKMITAKPPIAFVGVPYVAAMQDLRLDALQSATCLFSGSVREGARCFPSNVNVAASLALAGLGPDETRLEVWADPDLKRNTHSIEVEADSASFQMRIQNVPTDANPSTGRLTALSVMDSLLSLAAPLRVGS